MVSKDPLELQTTDVSNSTTFVMFQAHAHMDNLTISFGEKYVESEYTNGSDVGLLVELDVTAVNASCYVWCVTCSEGKNITIVVMATHVSQTGEVLSRSHSVMIVGNKFFEKEKVQYFFSFFLFRPNSWWM